MTPRTPPSESNAEARDKGERGSGGRRRFSPSGAAPSKSRDARADLAQRGAQFQVLSFYRNVIRTARAKDPELRAQILQYARLEMEKHRHIERRNVLLVEHYLRKGMKQLEIVQSGSVQVSSPV